MAVEGDARATWWSSLALLVAVTALLCLLPATAKSAPLPDGRAYEQVSPVDKGGSDIEPYIAMAALDGNRFAFVSRGNFAGQPTTLAGVEPTWYLSARGPGGWSTEGISPPNAQLSFGYDGYQAFTPDLSKGALTWHDDNRFGGLDPSAPLGENTYLRDTESKTFQLLSGNLEEAGEGGVYWGTPDFGKLALFSQNPLTPDAPSECGSCETQPFVYSYAYEWDHGDLRLASILPNDEPETGYIGARGGDCNFEHALSDDGSRLFWTDMEQKHLYVREDGTDTSLVSVSERSAPGGLSGFPVYFQDAEAAHGDKVLFTTKNSLVDADPDREDNSPNAGNSGSDEALDLYMYDFGKPEGERLTLLSNGGEISAVNHLGSQSRCTGVVGASDDLKRVYFLADDQLVPGDPTSPGPKLYLWEDQGAEEPMLRYIATIEESPKPSGYWINEAPAIQPGTGTRRQARWTADGRYLAFISSAQLTSFANEGENEIYLYDAVQDSLACVSCSEDAVPAHGEVAFEKASRPLMRPVSHLPQNVSSNGAVFFQTTRGLLKGDSNGKLDVYEYLNGQLHLISRGSGADHSTFLEATPSGSDVFFATRDKLVGWDKDGNVDAYDARVGGGFPEPPPVPNPCEGDACLPAPVVPNDPTPASSSFNGAGNVTPVKPRCKKGRVRRGGKCRTPKRHAKKHHRRNPSTRSNG